LVVGERGELKEGKKPWIGRWAGRVQVLTIKDRQERKGLTSRKKREVSDWERREILIYSHPAKGGTDGCRSDSVSSSKKGKNLPYLPEKIWGDLARALITPSHRAQEP